MLRSAVNDAALNKSMRPSIPYTSSRHLTVLHLRLASTVAPKSTTKSDVPPPNPPRASKKIELKPGPVKPAPLSPNTTPPRPPLQTSSHYRPPRHETSPKPLESSLNALALAKQDISSAVERGVLDPPPKDATPFKRFTHQALQLLKFYFRGLKAINTHRKQVAIIDARARSGGALPSRAEHRFIETYRRDLLKLVPFLLIIVVAEELVPLVALYAPRMLPSTCVLPGQRDRILSRARNQQLTAIFSHRSVLEAISRVGEQSGFVSTKHVGNPGAICGMLGLQTWGPSSLNAWRIRSHLNAIALDDERLRREGCGRHLTFPELEEALLERGMIPESDSSLANMDDMRGHLRWWLDNVEVLPAGSNPVSRRLLVLGLIGSQK